MPKLILRCNYLKNAPPSHLQNFVQYIGTREGVEKVSDTTALLPATAKQKELIQDILNRIEDADRMHEYYDYIQKPTRENASEFITGIGKQSGYYCQEKELHRLPCKQTKSGTNRHAWSVFLCGGIRGAFQSGRGSGKP